MLYASRPAFRLASTPPSELNQKFSIGITTFKDRFEEFFSPLLRDIAHYFADTQIIVYANGHVDAEGQARYLPQIESLCRTYHNVELATSFEPRGLSSIWNQIIRASRADRIVLLNDDLRITPAFRKKLSATGFFDTEVSLINNFWSHFLISKSVIGQVGWFDESFKEIGGEDDDYTYRLAIAGVPLESRHCLHVWNAGKPLRRNSYGHDMTGEHRYSKFNAERLRSKWIVSENPFPGSTLVPRTGLHVALRQGLREQSGSG